MVDATRRERMEMLGRFVELIGNIGVKLDISHYNCVLKVRRSFYAQFSVVYFQVHLDNHQPVVVSEFLESLSEVGVVPNRVTFQQCVALLCQRGEVEQALNIIKEKELSLNESVLLSLLSGYCSVNDSAAISSILKSLDDVGLASNSSQVLLLMANCFGERGNGEKVMETLATVEKEAVKLSDGDLLQLISSCCLGGLDSQVRALTSKLNKRPNFDILRNNLPAIARAGYVDLAGEIYISSLNIKQKMNRARKSSVSLDGFFLIRAMLKSDRDIISILEVVKKIEAAAENKVYIENLVLEAAQSRPESDCLDLIEAIRKDETVKLDLNNDKLVRRMTREYKVDYSGRFDAETLSSISENLKKFKAMGLPVPFTYISINLLPAIIDLKKKSPLETANELHSILPYLNWSFICNLVLGAILKTWTEENMRQAANFIININIGHARPSLWKLSLATSYIKTKNVDNFITIIAGALKDLKNEDKDLEKEIETLFGSLYHIRYNSKNDELLLPLLEELVNTKIGIPPSSAAALSRICTSSVSKELLNTCVADWNNRENYWTKQQEESFLEERRDKNRINTMKLNVLNKASQAGMKSNKISVSEMAFIQRELEAKNAVNGKIADNLMKAHIENDETDKALAVLSYCQKNREDFFMSPSVLDLLVEKMIAEKRSTIDLVLDHMNDDKGRKIFISSLINSLADLARQGHHHQVVSILETFNPNLVLMERGANASSLLKVYSDQGDVQKVEEIFTCLLSKGLGNTDFIVNLAPLVEVHLVNNDLSGAVTEFLRLARLYKKMPLKFELTRKLIEAEDIQSIQAVLDASIEIIGESKSLYDLTFSFLVLGKTSQATKLFQTAGLTFQKNKMVFMFDMFQKLDNLQAADDLVEVSKVIFGCDRDFMYHKLVQLYRDNQTKVRDIVSMMEEEKVVPSYILQNEIDEILGERKSEANSSLNLDDEVTRAIDLNDLPKALDIVMTSFEQENTSLKCKRDFIERMIVLNKIPEASAVATRLANSFKNPEKVQFTNLYYKLLHILHPSKRTPFLLSLNKGFRKILRDGESSYNNQRSLSDKSEKDSEVLEAFDDDNMTKVLILIATREPSVRAVNFILHKLLQQERLEEAGQVAQIVCRDSFLDQFHFTTQANINSLLRKYSDRKELEKIEDFVTKLSPRANLLLRGDIWVKASKLKMSPDSYFQHMFDHQDDSKKWMVNTQVLLEAIVAHPSIESRLVELSDKKFVPAIVLLTKLRLAEENMTEFERLVVDVPEPLLSGLKNGMFDGIDTRDKMKSTLNSMKNLNMNKMVLVNIANCYLSINKKSNEFADLATAVIEEDGLKLRDISKSLLVRLANDNKFKYQTEARKFIDLAV